MSKKILIIGNSTKAYALAKFLSKNNKVFVSSNSDSIKEFATCLDIREDATSELLEFVLENDIDITIPVSEKTLNTNLVEILTNNNQAVFAPTKNVTNIIFDKSAIKKILYKLKVPTPKFGIFEKQNMALDYIKNLKTPFVIKTNEPSSAIVLTSSNTAKNILETYFSKKNQRVIIEDYVWGTPFSFYAITDGYNALPIGSSLIYRHSLEGDGGQITTGMGACSPNYKLSIENEHFLMEEVINQVLEYLESGGNTYLGILGVNGIICPDGTLQILGFQTFLQDCDCTAILELLDTDIIKLIYSCIIGSFSDEVNSIYQKDMSATSLVLTCKNKENSSNIIYGLDNLDENTKIDFYPQVKKNKYLEYEADIGAVIVLTSIARTLSSSTKLVYNEAQCIDFKGLFYRKDICKYSNNFN